MNDISIILIIYAKVTLHLFVSPQSVSDVLTFIQSQLLEQKYR